MSDIEYDTFSSASDRRTPKPKPKPVEPVQPHIAALSRAFGSEDVPPGSFVAAAEEPRTAAETSESPESAVDYEAVRAEADAEAGVDPVISSAEWQRYIEWGLYVAAFAPMKFRALLDHLDRVGR